MFLQAAGRDPKSVADIAGGRLPADASVVDAELIRFADHLTAHPSEFTPEDTDRLRAVLHDEGQVIEAANVVAGFNFANRVADALDVRKEIPGFFEEHGKLYSFAMRVMSWAMRFRMNFAIREIPAQDPVMTLAKLCENFKNSGMGCPPAYFDCIFERPYLLEQHAATQESLLLSNVLPRALVCKIGLLVSALNHDWRWSRNWASLLSDTGMDRHSLEHLLNGEVPPQASGFDSDLLLLARQITLDASGTTDFQIRTLRKHGFSDRHVLAFVLIVAGFNAANRLDLALCAKTEMTSSPSELSTAASA